MSERKRAGEGRKWKDEKGVGERGLKRQG